MAGTMQRRPALSDLFDWIGEGLPGLRGGPGAHMIRIEENLADDMYTLRAELPGVDPAKDVEISISDDMLTLKAERSTQSTGKHRTEFHYGTFTRSVRLPAGARGEEAAASYKDGVLTVTVPVSEATKESRTIEVRHG
ncbi:Hsp20/alpha crystallin family protein [Streptomyces sp. GC420]|uniref:Hsp20/alpha crystallin family protein n=1 Tax=Streptomyces sp. GC420 TaxID=2697568 RepID=UPI001415246B|nr:Hsp20/alpha crystallin family protein [Streptomyces sp. GC420]NBM18835.1 Hsp20 family protein [Streptomyces sp. GC420]